MDKQIDQKLILRSLLHYIEMREKYFKEDSKIDSLYHYTNISALISILENKQIRFSNCFFLNDLSEIKYGVNLVKEVINSKKTQNKNGVGVDFSKILELFELLPPKDIFVFCLCEDSDLLSQWKGYSKENFGIAIKFKKSVNFETEIAFKSKVIYDTKKQYEIIEYLLDLNFRTFNTISKNELELFYLGIYLQLLYTIVFFKHPKFYEEKEWRMVYYYENSPEPNIEYCQRGNYLVPYINLDFKKDQNTDFPIEAVIIGPNNNELFKSSIKYILEKYPFQIKIENSIIPYF